MAAERLHKILAWAGVASLRAAEELIRSGRVTVNGKTVEAAGARVDPGKDHIRVDGRRVRLRPQRPVYLMLNKPQGYVTTMEDPQGRATVVDLLPKLRQRVFPVGRLDYWSEGLLLMTNDGELARGLTHPRFGVAKTYRVKVRRELGEQALARLRRGVRIDRRAVRLLGLRLDRPGRNPWYEVKVAEGRNRLIRKIFDAVGHPVMRLRRTALGGVKLGRLPAGACRELRPEEVERLRRAVAGGSA